MLYTFNAHSYQLYLNKPRSKSVCLAYLGVSKMVGAMGLVGKMFMYSSPKQECTMKRSGTKLI